MFLHPGPSHRQCCFCHCCFSWSHESVIWSRPSKKGKEKSTSERSFSVFWEWRREERVYLLGGGHWVRPGEEGAGALWVGWGWRENGHEQVSSGLGIGSSLMFSSAICKVENSWFYYRAALPWKNCCRDWAGLKSSRVLLVTQLRPLHSSERSGPQTPSKGQLLYIPSHLILTNPWSGYILLMGKPRPLKWGCKELSDSLSTACLALLCPQTGHKWSPVTRLLAWGIWVRGPQAALRSFYILPWFFFFGF